MQMGCLLVDGKFEKHHGTNTQIQGIALGNARMPSIRNCTIATGVLSIRHVREYWTSHTRFRGTGAWDVGRAE